MSKIYEALRRAEQERTPTRKPLAPLPPSMDEFPSNGLPDLPPAPIPALAPPSLPMAAAVLPLPLDPVPVARTPVWNPSRPQLPALEERGAAVEQFRSLRSRMHEFRDNHKLKTILVSSGLPQEGKSFVAANLAIAFARHKASRVLLIDGDMRRSSLHRLLGAPVDPGLSEYLAGTATLAEVLQKGVTGDGKPIASGLASLTFIAGGGAGDKAADLSGNRRFDHLLTTLAPAFDWIVVDSSPVNLVADGVNLAHACDGILFVVRGGVTRYESAQRALGELKASTVLGVVLNAVTGIAATRGYYGYDSYDSLDPQPDLESQHQPEPVAP